MMSEIFATNKTCSFFGHRVIFNKEILLKKLKSEIEKLVNGGVNNFLVGTHGEFDRLVLTALREIRRSYKEIKISIVFTSVYAFKKDKFSFSLADYYDDVETLIYEIEDEHFKRKITKTNQCMIDDSDYVVCCVDLEKTQSGAKRALKYAVKKNKSVINLF